MKKHITLEDYLATDNPRVNSKRQFLYRDNGTAFLMAKRMYVRVGVLLRIE
ncbi:hypothetical protein [Sporosarcina sp. 6E9]|uniref:hypothetical protein n=1 Tax=Sporosarcina sp. 6E9 TaxID=2819235 RepID=UPI001B30EF3F|nr:hypothetical protein [Sporosarcina sp. 6E9]